jgi:hypothetical protein
MKIIIALLLLAATSAVRAQSTNYTVRAVNSTNTATTVVLPASGTKRAHLSIRIDQDAHVAFNAPATTNSPVVQANSTFNFSAPSSFDGAVAVRGTTPTNNPNVHIWEVK